MQFPGGGGCIGRRGRDTPLTYLRNGGRSVSSTCQADAPAVEWRLHSEANLLGDDLLHDFGGAAPDTQDARIAIVPFDLGLA